jgi:hypothetical protein
VSSGSDIERVYVSSVEAGSYTYACSTNNNRPCGGARGRFCNHILALNTEAVLQYGADRVARYLRVDVTSATLNQPLDGIADITAIDITAAMELARPVLGDATAASAVFSRFLRHLAYLELAPTTAPLPEMQWFPTTNGSVTASGSLAAGRAATTRAVA